MTDITLTFTPEMERLIYQGKKICTIRENRHGARGDTFKDSRGNQYDLIAVIPTKLKQAIDIYYQLEGFDSPRELFDYWCKIKDIDENNRYDFTRAYHNKPAFVHFFKLHIEG